MKPLLRLLSMSALLVGCGLLLVSVYDWLRYGVWATWSLATVVYQLGNEAVRDWLLVPDDWIMVSTIVNRLPLWLAFFLFSALLEFWAQSVPEPSARSS